MIVNFLNTVFLLLVFVTTGCVVGEIQAPVDSSGATISSSLTSISPSSGPSSGGTTLTLTGQAFSTGMTVDISGIACSPITVLSSTSATCTTGAHSLGVKNVTINDSEGNSDTLFNGFTYRSAPDATSVSPTVGSTVGGTALTITGSNFFSGASVAIDGVACTSVNVLSSTSLTCFSGANTAGLRQITVTNDDGQADATPVSFTYAQPPNIASISPDASQITGGSSITITGSNFTGTVNSVTINGITCATPSVGGGNTTITCDPGDNSASGAGVYDVVVTNNNGVSGTMVDGFTYQGPPTITAVSPNGGPIAGTNTITISGTGFDTSNGYTATIGGSPCASYANQTATSFDCVVPPGVAGLANIIVTNNDVGTQSDADASLYTYQAGPTITTTAAANGLAVAGSVNGGTPLVITGTNFINPSVRVGSSPCTITSPATATTINCTTTAGTAGTVNVIVTNEDTQPDTDVGAFIYQAAPTITGISPTAGSQLGGTTVTITGSNLDGVSGIEVYFGDVSLPSNECTGYSAITAGSFTCTTPSGVTNSTADVSVIIQDGDKQTDVLSPGYTFQQAPTITSISPDSGTASGDTAVTLTGTNFRTGATVTIGGLTCTSPNVVSSTSLTCNSPSGTLGARDVVVTNSDNQFGTLTGGYTYRVAPTLTSVSPLGGRLSGSFTMTLTGTNFYGSPTVTVGGDNCPVATANATTITCSVPANPAGNVDVVVSNPDNQTGPLSNAFRYQAAPTITNISPPGGPTSGALMSFTITGTGFNNADGIIVTVDGNPCDSVTVNSPTEVECDPPAGTLGLKNVALYLNDGGNQSVALANGYLYAVAPTFSSISPTGGPRAGGTDVTITGTDFQDGASVSIGSAPCTPVIFDSSTQLRCTTTARGASGIVNVVVTNPDQQTDSVNGASAYTYADPISITSVVADNGDSAGGSNITINGLNILNGVTAYINGVACAPTAYIDINSMTCVTPPGTAGPVDVRVVNPFGQEDTAVNGFTYVDQPTLSTISPGIGPVSGVDGNGDPITITLTGTGFDNIRGIASVTLNGTACLSPNASSSTVLTCTLSPGTVGNGDVVLVNNDGDSTTVTLTSGFSYIAAPTVASVDIPNGPSDGGTVLTVTGTNFLAGGPTTVAIGALGTCGSVNVINSTTLTCTTSAGTVGTAAITVTNFDGQSATGGSFTYDPPPVITSLSQTSGRLAGGSSLVITGQNFVATPTISVGGSPCTSPFWASVTSISCTLPAGVAGPADVSVTNPDGQVATSSGGFTYAAVPNITGVNPSVISTGTTTNLTLTGTDFFQGSGITITIDPGTGNYVCTSPSFISTTQVTCTAPSGVPAGSYEILVTNGDGDSQSDTTTGGTLNYVDPPTISGIAPANGPLAGGGTIIITGSNFGSPPLPTVDVGGQACTNVIFDSATQIRCDVPSVSAAATVNVQATFYNNILSTTDTYTYDPPPTVTSVSPTFGDDSGGTLITITGSNFVATPSSITVGGVACTGPAFTDANTVTCTTGANATTDTALNIVVTNPDGQVGTGNTLYTYLDPPTITSVSPSGGRASGGETITITGSNFTNPASVSINGSTCTGPTITGETTITCTSPVLAGTATYNLTVTNNDGQTDVELNSWQAQAEPTITNVSPDNGDESGSTTVTVTGTNFESGGTVFFGTTGVSFDSFSATSVVVTAPSGTAGATVDITLQNLTGQSATDSAAYTYNPASPEVEWQVGTVSPNPPNPALYSSAVATNSSLTFTLRNIGSAQTGVLSTSISGANTGAFFINADTCTGVQLNPLGECTVDVIFLGAIVGAGGSYDGILNATDGATSNANILEARP